jgi:hypothetical protein
VARMGYPTARCGAILTYQGALEPLRGFVRSRLQYLPLLHRRFAFFDRALCFVAALGSFSRRTKANPRFSSAARSVSSVATCTGLPDSLPSQAFNSSGVVVTNLIWRRTGIPSDAHRWTTEADWPKNATICCQPVRASASTFNAARFFARFGITIFTQTTPPT